MAHKQVVELMLDILEEAGVERIYGVVGDSLNGMIDAIRQRGTIRWIPVRHEEAGAFAAGAEAHLTGTLTVCAGSCGPGNLHLINGLYDAHRSRVPLLAIAAQIPSQEIGSNYFQETNPQHLFKECSHYCELISQPNQMPRTLEIAMQTAITKRGVAVIILSGDTATKAAPESKARLSFKIPASPLMIPSGEELHRLAQFLNTGKKVTIFGGAGCAGAHSNLLQVAEKLKAPIVHALRGKEHIEYANPYDVGLTGLLGFSSGYFAMMNCDVLLMLGTDFPYRQFYPEKAIIVQIDQRGENLGRRTRLDLGLIGNIKPTLEALIPLLDDKEDRAHLDRALTHYAKTRKELDGLAVGISGRKPIHPQFLAKVLSDLAAADAIFSCDVGTPTVWAARYLMMNGQRRLLGSFCHGSMANAMPQAIGAQMTFPHRQVVSMSGDGGFAMLMGDLLTIKQLKLPIKIVVFNNGALGFVELEMKAAGLLEHGTELENPNFAKLAEAAGIRGIRLEDPSEVEAGIRAALLHDGPVLVDAVVNRLELSMPPTIKLDQALGFSLYGLKAVMNGRGDEVLDLARTNLWR